MAHAALHRDPGRGFDGDPRDVQAGHPLGSDMDAYWSHVVNWATKGFLIGFVCGAILLNDVFWQDHIEAGLSEAGGSSWFDQGMVGGIVGAVAGALGGLMGPED